MKKALLPEKFVLRSWRNLVSKLFIPPCPFLASANACAILFL